jgi:hypothetical protein
VEDFSPSTIEEVMKAEGGGGGGWAEADNGDCHARRSTRKKKIEGVT